MAKERIGGAFVEVTAPMAGFMRSLAQGQQAFTGFAKTVTGLAVGVKTAIAGIALGFGALGVAKATLASRSFVELAASAEEMQRRSAAAFANTTVNVQAWARETANATGLVANSLLEMAGKFQVSFLGMGVGSDQAATLSLHLSRLANQMIEIGDATPQEVFSQLVNAMRGATGIAEEQAAALKNLQRLIAPYVASAAGLSGASATYTSVTQQLSKALQDLATIVGQIMMPIFQGMKAVMLGVIKVVSGVVGAFAALPRIVRFVIGGFVLLVGVVGPAVIAFKLLVIAVRALQPQIAALTAQMFGLSAAQAAVATTATVAKIALQRFLASLPVIGLVLLGASLAAEALFLLFGKGAGAADDMKKSVDEITKALERAKSSAAGTYRILGSLGKQFFAPTATAAAGPGGGGMAPAPAMVPGFRPILPDAGTGTTVAAGEGGIGRKIDQQTQVMRGIRRDLRMVGVLR